MNSPGNGSRNRLLAMLSDPDRDLLTPALEAVALDLRQVLEAPNEPISHVYFLESGLVSIVGTAPPQARPVGLGSPSHARIASINPPTPRMRITRFIL
jgi:hypothetical protein